MIGFIKPCHPDFQVLSHHKSIDITLLKKYQDKPWDLIS